MNSNGNTNADTATVYGEEGHVPGLSGWLAEIDEQGYVMVPDWISQQRVNQYIGVPRTRGREVNARTSANGSCGPTRAPCESHGPGIGQDPVRRPDLKMVDRVHFGYDINDPDMPAIG